MKNLKIKLTQLNEATLDDQKKFNSLISELIIKDMEIYDDKS